MKRIQILTIGLALLIFTNLALATEEPIAITAMAAFDSYADQLDPISGEEARVAIVDVRTTAEYYWVGSPARVDRIITISGEEIVPFKGKVISMDNGRVLKYYQQQSRFCLPNFIPASKVAEIESTDIATSVPLLNWDDNLGSKVANPAFASQMQALADEGIEVVILMCRSGKRSTKAPANFDTAAFMGVYEIDQPNGKNARGGFEGTSYDDSYNGYRGYPGRKTQQQENPSVSWKDAGLPIHIGWSGK